MARANRHFIPGHIWHLTHRCHTDSSIMANFYKPFNTNTHKALAKTHRRWVESQLKNAPERQEHFSGSIAVGSQAYIQKVRQAHGIKEIGRRMAEATAVAGYQLKESVAKYGSADLNQAESHQRQSASPVANTIPWKWERL